MIKRFRSPKKKKLITILPSGYGHWQVTIYDYYRKHRTFITNHSTAIDDYKHGEDNPRRRNKGYKALLRICRISLNLG